MSYGMPRNICRNQLVCYDHCISLVLTTECFPCLQTSGGYDRFILVTQNKMCFSSLPYFRCSFLVVSFSLPGSGGGNKKERGSVVSLYNQPNKLFSPQFR